MKSCAVYRALDQELIRNNHVLTAWNEEGCGLIFLYISALNVK